MISKKIGLIGAGQLAMLTAMIAKKYNIEIMCLDPYDNPPAKKYCKIIKANYNDEKALKSLFINNNFISYEIENIDLNVLQKCIDEFPDKCIQDIYPLFLTNNRLREKLNLINNEIKTNKFSIIKNPNEVFYFLFLYKKILIKTSTLGYDGKGQILIENKNIESKLKDVDLLLKKSECIVEEFVDFEYEISLTGVYYKNNKYYFLPLNKNIHLNGILHKTEILQNNKLQKQAETIFKKFSESINARSIYTIEFFVDKYENIYVNEIAPRVHNSSHHGIDNYNVSQYDLLLSLFYDLKLPKLKILNHNILINVLGQHYKQIKNKSLTFDNNKIKFYDYNKNEIRKNRKMGHLIISSSETKLIEKYEKWCKV